MSKNKQKTLPLLPTTGKEAARKMMKHYLHLQEDEELGAFWSPEEAEQTLDNLSVEEYVIYMALTRAYDSLIKLDQEAAVYALQIRDLLGRISRYVEVAVLSFVAKQAQIMKPAIMTEQQYQDKLAEHKHLIKKEVFNFNSLLELRLEEEAGEDLLQEYDYDLELLLQDKPALLPLALSSLITLLKAGKLEAVELHQSDVDKIENMVLKRRSLVIRDAFRSRERATQLSQERRRFSREQYDLAQARQRGSKTKKAIKLLEDIKHGKKLYSKEATEKELALFFCDVEQLMAAGLQEWLSYFERAVADPDPLIKGDMLRRQNAIIQDPDHYLLDDRGYYKDLSESLLQLLVMDDYLDGAVSEVEGTSFEEDIDEAKMLYKALIAAEETIEALSNVFELDITKNIKYWHEGAMSAIDHYNEAFSWSEEMEERFSNLYHAKETGKKAQSVRTPILPDGMELSKFYANRLKPDKGALEVYRNRIAPLLGSSWWEPDAGIKPDPGFIDAILSTVAKEELEDMNIEELKGVFSA